MQDICIIVAEAYSSIVNIAKAVSHKYEIPIFSTEEVKWMSLSRYDKFIYAGEPDSFTGRYLLNQFPGRISFLTSSAEPNLLAKQLKWVKSEDVRSFIVTNEEDKKGLSCFADKIEVLCPPAYGEVLVSLYGVDQTDVHWLKVLSKLSKMGGVFYIIPPFHPMFLDTLQNFPVQYSVVTPESAEAAIISSRILVCGDGVKGNILTKKATFLRSVVMDTKEFSDMEIEDIHKKLKVESITDYDFNHKIEKDTVFLMQGIKLEKQLKKLLIKFPTRGRPEKFYSLLNQYILYLSKHNEIKFLISIDSDDETMSKKDIDEFFDKYEGDDYSHISYEVNVNKEKGKVTAINSGMEGQDFDFLLLASDDMIPNQVDYDDVILQAAEKYFPDTDGVLWFNDGYVGKRLNTLVCMGKKYYERFNYIYNPEYISLWCDNEFMKVAAKLGKQIYIDWILFKHEHPANTKDAQTDSLYNENDKHYFTDKAIFDKREKANFGVFNKKKIISFLMPTLVKRRKMRERLITKIQDQIDTLFYTDQIEILIDEDKGEKSIGEKRNDLVSRATGTYIAFIDDDDDISDNFIETIMAASLSEVTDCVSFGGLVVKADNTCKPFYHSVIFQEYFEDSIFYYRPPNHLNLVKKEIAVKYPFPDKSFSEDTDYAIQMLKAGALKTEAFVPIPLYIYLPTNTGASVVKGREATKGNVRLTEKEQETSSGPKLAGIRTQGIKYEEDKANRKSQKRKGRRKF